MSVSRKKRALRLALSATSESVLEHRADDDSDYLYPAEEADVAGNGTDALISILNDHFQALLDLFPYERVRILVRALIGNRSDEIESDNISHELLKTLRIWSDNRNYSIDTDTAAQLETVAAASLMAAFRSWTKKLRLHLSPSDALLKSLSSWATGRANQILRLIGKTTCKGIAEIVKNGVESGLSVSAIMRQIRNYLEDTGLGVNRAKRIAETEINIAMNHGAFEANKELGATHKRWITLRDIFVCRVCLMNEGQGSIPIERTFRSGDQAPPAHPSCRCAADFSGVTRCRASGTVD